MKLNEYINFSTDFSNYFEDNEIIIEIDKKCDNKEFFKEIKNNYLKYGVDFIKKMNSAFWMYVYDKRKEILIIISDMVGLDSIYYHMKDKSIYIGNDVIELMNNCNLEKNINKQALSIYFKYHYISSPETIFTNTYKLKHGKYLIFQDGKIEIKTYWNIIDKFNNKKIIKSYDIVKKELDEKLNNYIKNIIENKDNLGIYLSGGIDSSLVSAISMKYSKKAVDTFSIGFFDQKCNEAEKSKRIANQIGTNHHEFYIDKETALETVKKIPYYYTQPFADTSELATIVLNEFAKKNNIANVLTGDGADQIFCGSLIYDTMFKVQKAHKILNPLNIKINPKFIRNNKKLFYIFSNSDKQYQDQCDIIYYETFLKGLLKNDDTRRLKSETQINSKNWQQRRLFFDFDTFCCERVLTKMGVAAQKNDIEVFSPFLDREIIEYSLRIPHKYKYYKKIKKYILKEILFEYVPKELIETKKHGFSIPTYIWLQTLLNEDLKRVSTQEFIEKQDIFNYDYISMLINNIDDKKFTSIIWDYYIFQLWYETYILAK